MIIFKGVIRIFQGVIIIFQRVFWILQWVILRFLGGHQSILENFEGVICKEARRLGNIRGITVSIREIIRKKWHVICNKLSVI